jgi:hypothetical protein
VPTQGSDPTLYFADLGVGYWLYRAGCDSDRGLTAVVPTVEAHMNTSLDNSSRNTSQVYFPDYLVVMGGVHVGLFNSAWLTLAGGLPVTGPRPYRQEYQCMLNVRF